jgi:hypothetical protein
MRPKLQKHSALKLAGELYHMRSHVVQVPSKTASVAQLEAQVKLVSPKFQKLSALKYVGRTIPP